MKLSPAFRFATRGLAVLIVALAIYHLQHSSYSFWILLTAGILYQSTTGATFIRTSNRIFGTLFGVLTGALIMSLVPFNNYIYFTILSISLFCMVYFFIYSYAKSVYFLGIFLITILSFFIGYKSQSEIFIFASVRTADTIIGGLIVIIMSYFIWPQHAADDIKKNFYHVFNNFKDMTNQVLIQVEPKKYEQTFEAAFKNIVTIESLAKDAQAELSDFLLKESTLQSIIRNMFIIHRCFITIATNNLTIINLSSIEQENINKKLKNFSLILLDVLTNIQEFEKITHDYKIWQNATVTILALGDEINQYEKDTPGLSVQTHEGNRLLMLIVNLRQIIVHLQFIFSAIEQIRS
jgi:uncharacterized membrane protein YgaE (UPF0421/DUF939 family)